MPAASRATSSSACTAWARCSTSCCCADHPAAAVPGLCAGRRPSRSARLSGAAPAGERRQFLVRVGRGRSGGAGRGHPEAPAGLDRRRAACAPPEDPAAARPLCVRAAQFRRRRVRRPREPRRAARGDPRAPAMPRRPATPLIDGDRAQPGGASVPSSRRSTARRSAACAKATTRSRRPPWRRRRRGFAAWAATPVETRAAALERAGDLLEARRGRLIALLQAEGGKTLDDAVAEVREAVDFCRYYAARGAPRARARRRCRARPAKRTSCAIAAAACSSASARGISRSRSSSAR